MRAEEGLHSNDDGCTEKHPPLTAKQFNLRWQHYCREPLAFYFPTSSGHHFTCWVMTKHLQSQVSGLFNLCATFQRLHLQIACRANSNVQQNVWLGLGKWQWERWLLQSRESRGGTVFTLFFSNTFSGTSPSCWYLSSLNEGLSVYTNNCAGISLASSATHFISMFFGMYCLMQAKIWHATVYLEMFWVCRYFHQEPVTCSLLLW